MWYFKMCVFHAQKLLFMAFFLVIYDTFRLPYKCASTAGEHDTTPKRHQSLHQQAAIFSVLNSNFIFDMETNGCTIICGRKRLSSSAKNKKQKEGTCVNSHSSTACIYGFCGLEGGELVCQSERRWFDYSYLLSSTAHMLKCVWAQDTEQHVNSPFMFFLKRKYFI